MAFVDSNVMRMLDECADDQEDDEEQDYWYDRYSRFNLPKENYADIFDQEREIITTKAKKKEEEENERRRIQNQVTNSAPKNIFIIKKEIDENRFKPKISTVVSFNHDNMFTNSGISKGHDIVISSSKDFNAILDSNNDQNINSGLHPPSVIKFDKEKSQIGSLAEPFWEGLNPPNSFGNGLFGSKVLVEWWYNNRWDPPRDPSDIFYEGRMLGNKDKMNDWLLAIREFGYVMVVEKSEVAKGRFKLVCERGSKKRKRLIGDYDDTLCTRWFAYVNIHGFRVNVAQMDHSHSPAIIAPEKHFMGLLQTDRYSKEKEDYEKENKIITTSYQQLPRERKRKSKDILDSIQGISKYNNKLLDDWNMMSAVENGVIVKNDTSLLDAVKQEIWNQLAPKIESKHPRFDIFKEARGIDYDSI